MHLEYIGLVLAGIIGLIAVLGLVNRLVMWAIDRPDPEDPNAPEAQPPQKLA